MPILTTLALENVLMMVGADEVQLLDENGQPVLDTDAPVPIPVLRKRTLLIFTDPASHTRVVIPLVDEAKQALIQQLTGGIVVAHAGALGER